MRKLVASFLALVLCLSCVGFAAAEEPITLDVIIAQYGPNTQEWFLGTTTGMGDGKNFVQAFEEANPDVKLNLEVVSWTEIYTEVSTRIANNNTPDVLNIDSFADYANEGLLLPIDDYVPDELRAQFMPEFLNESVIDGVTWAVPDLASIRPLYYNKDILDEVGVEVPTTWDELRDVCQAIIDVYDGAVYPWGLDFTTDEGQAAFGYYAWNNNGGFVDADNNWALNSAANVESVQFSVGLYKDGYTNPNPDTQNRYDLQDMFGAGKIAMMIGPNGIPTYLKSKGYEINYGFTYLPTNEGAANTVMGVMDRIMAFRDDAAPDQAARNAAIAKFVQFFYSDEVYVPWVTMEDFLPATGAGMQSMIDKDPTYQTWLDLLGRCKFYPAGKKEWIDVKQGVIEVEQKAMLGEDPQTLLDALQQKVTAE